VARISGISSTVAPPGWVAVDVFWILLNGLPAISERYLDGALGAI